MAQGIITIDYEITDRAIELQLVLREIEEIWAESGPSEPWNKGRTGVFSGETLERMSAAQRGSLGNNWQGGKSLEPYDLGFDEFRRETVRERDGHECVFCGKSEADNGKPLDVHHINYDKRNSSFRNLVALCISCHSRAGSDRDTWQEYFTLYIGVTYGYAVNL